MSGSAAVTVKKLTLEKEIKKQVVQQNSLSFEQEQAAAFELERERKVVAVKAHEAKEEETVGKFLKYVVEGEQDQAEELLKEMPGLALKKGSVTDLSKREFKSITGFQYALWALDWHMWKMLLKYLSKEAVAEQFAELEKKGTAHGKHFSLAPLIDALNGPYINKYDNLNDPYINKYKEAGRQSQQSWRCDVIVRQLLLPVHVVNEYCHPSRSFVFSAGFVDATLPRSRKLYGDQGEWFTRGYNQRNVIVRYGYETRRREKRERRTAGRIWEA